MDSLTMKNEIDTGDGRNRPNESSGADVPSKKVEDGTVSVDLGAKGKGKDVVTRSDSGDDPLKKSIALGKITTTGSSMYQMKIKQEILEVDYSFKEFVETTKAVVGVRKKLNERLRQQNLPGGICIQKDISDDYKNMIKDVKTQHYKSVDLLSNNSILGGGCNLEVVDSHHDHHDDVNQSGETATLTEGNGKHLVVSEKIEELKKQQFII